MPANLVCELCSKTFNKTFNLKRHYKHVHYKPDYTPPEKVQTFRSNSIKCPNCTSSFCDFSKFHDHLLTSHEIEVQTEHLSFSDENEFMLWKTSMEDRENSLFVKTRTGYFKKGKEQTNLIFKCNRSGFFKSKVESPSKRKRHLKLQGSSKIDACCPARIKVQIQKNQVLATFFKTHVGHVTEIKHLPLPQKDKQELASKIAEKIPFDVILDDVRASVSNVLKRKHILTKQDLRNIVKEYSLESECIRHTNEALSVEAWVEQEKSSEENSVLLYKPNGVALLEYPDLEKNDFLLGIMTHGQAEMLKKYGNDVICIDSTHGTNAYSFEMTTLLVLDDMQHGFPCAFFFSNRNNHISLEKFLQAVRNKVGPIRASTMMTADMADIFHIAWKNVMGDVERRLYCTWHVQRAWHNKINKTVKDNEKRKEALKRLHTLLNEVDENTFEHILPVIVKDFCNDPDTKELGVYFNEQYVKNFRDWAYCYRKNAGINTNMHLERLHGIFKHLYLKGKMANRLDLTIHALMRFVKGNLFDRVVILHKGKVTNKVRNIRDRHKKSLMLKAENVLPSSNNTWTVFSSAAAFGVFTVSFNDVKCNCSLVCQTCKTCIHKFTCTCIDACIKWNMCKHIHLVCRQIIAMKKTENSAQESSVDVCTNTDKPETDLNNLTVIGEGKSAILKAVSTGNAVNSESLESLKCDATTQFFDIIQTARTVQQMKMIKKNLESLQSKVKFSSQTI